MVGQYNTSQNMTPQKQFIIVILILISTSTTIDRWGGGYSKLVESCYIGGNVVPTYQIHRITGIGFGGMNIREVRM